MRLKKEVKIALVIIIIILVFVLLALLKSFLAARDKVPENDPNVAGNTTGNIYNGGYFVESNSTVYFANPYDNGNIYVMDSDQQNIHRLFGGNNSFLNIAGNYLYCYSASSGAQNDLGYVLNGRGLYRSRIDGKKTYSLTKCETDSMILVGNHLYYTVFEDDSKNKDQAIVTVHSVTTGNEDEKTVINEHVKIGGYNSGILYYNGMDNDHYLHGYNIASGTSSDIFNESVYLPTVYNGYIYYLDLNDHYHLKRYSLSDESIEVIVDERVDLYNLYGDIIYYQNCNPDDYALKRVYTDGTGLEVVANGVYKNICATSSYVYFTEFNNELPLYCTPTYGPVNVTTFDAALQAVTPK